MRFTKMEGLGNDYIYINGLDQDWEGLPQLSRRLSRPHFGVGSDGLICVRPGRTGDFTMEMYNADGSRGAMCGNGIRCLGKYVYDKGFTRKTCLTIDTDAGPRALEMETRKGRVERVTVDMGEARLGPKVTLEAAGRAFSALPVWVGNPHAVILCPNPEQEDLERLGPELEHHPALPERSNIEFAAVSGDVLTIRVWERGSGLTLACGTGACAVFGAARREGLCGPSVRAELPGGSLLLEEREGRIFLTGPARTVFEGELPDEH